MDKTYLVISDIHGSLDGALLVKNAFKKHNADCILCLGDILYHGPRNDLPNDYYPKKVIPILNDLANYIISVRGNCDAEVDQMVLDFACTSDYNIIPYQNNKIFMSHGHIYSPNNLPTLNKGDLFLSGHTHIPTAELNNEGIYLLNPGSISLPKNGHPKTYGTLQNNIFNIYTIENDLYMSITIDASL